MIPFSTEVFHSVVAQYNAANWPWLIVLNLLGLVALLLALRPRAGSDRIVALVLALLWIWTGVMFHMLHFAAINWGAWLFGALFVLQGVLFATTGLRRDRLRFAFSPTLAGWFGLGCALLAMGLIPLLALTKGLDAGSLRSFAVAPTPLTLFTLGLLLLAVPPVPRPLLIVPLIWCLIGGAAAWALPLPEDLALSAAGLIACGAIVWRNRRP